MSQTTFLRDLNRQQRQAVEAISGPVLVLAGPGSGKTRVLTYRIAYLVRVCGVRPHNIMAVTFTNKAAREMEERLTSLLGEQDVRRLTIGTFHAIGVRILRREAQHVGIDPQFLIYDTDDQLGLVRQAMRELDLSEKEYKPSSVLHSISQAKDRQLDPQAHAGSVSSYWEEIVSRIYRVYERKLAENRALDFDDLLLKTVELFQDHPQVLQRYQERYVHVLVDEYQDTNYIQYMMVRHLSGGYRNLFVVGDEEQAIYAWRGATLRNILEFESDFPEARIFLLEQNYRSTQSILQSARAVISGSAVRPYEKALWTENPAGEPIVVRETYDETDEARMVADEITRLQDKGHNLGDIAVMYRTNAQSRAFEEAFIRYGLRYKLVGGTRFYQRREVRDILAYLRLLHNPFDTVSLLRIINVPPRGIGPRTVEAWREWAATSGQPLFPLLAELGDPGDPVPEEVPLSTRAAKALRRFRSIIDDLVDLAAEKPLPELIDIVLQRISYQSYLLRDRETGPDRWENVQELQTVARDFAAGPPSEGLATFLEETALIADIDDYDDAADAITLITLHQAKGLEFPVVFVVGLEEGLLPHARSMTSEEELEEERRLCYVGMTRAKKRLYLLRAFKRTIFGTSDVRTPSRFLANIDPDAVSTRRTASARSTRRRGHRRPTARRQRRAAATPASEKPAYKPGQRVRHPTFGQGTVISVENQGQDQKLTVAFEGQGLKKLLASFAKLERL